jgi:hypothetical protein
MRVNGFTGNGTYESTGGDTDEDVFVGIRGSSAELSTADLDDCTDNICTIEVTNDDVTTVASGERGTVALTLSCPLLTGQGASCFECSVSPSTIQIEIEGCENTD